MSNEAEPHPLLSAIAAVVQARFTEVPDRPGHALPTSEEAILSVELALGEARQRWEDEPEIRQGTAEDQADVLLQLEQLAQVCRAAREVGFSGKLSTIFGAALVVIALLIVGRQLNSVPVMAAACLWTATVPLYLRSAVAPRWTVYSRLLSPGESLDDRLLGFVAKGPPILAPLALLLRALLFGALAPALVLLEARRSGKVHIAVVMTAVSVMLIYWGWTYADWQPPPG